MREIFAAIVILAALWMPASAQLTTQQQKNERLQHAGERDEWRCPKAVYEFLPKRRPGGNERTALHKREAVWQFLHRHEQGLP
jgi:hypothetical protein